MQSRRYFKKLSSWHDPESVFAALFNRSEYAFWLDSSKVEKGLSRFSFMGDSEGPLSKRIIYSLSKKEVSIIEKNREKRITKSIFDYLETALSIREDRDVFNPTAGSQIDHLPFDFIGGFVGYFGYELQAECGSQSFHTSEFPDAYFLFSDRFLAFDHQEKEIYLICLAESKQEAEEWIQGVTLKITNEELRNYNSSKISPSSEKLQTSRKEEFITSSKSHEEYIKDIEKCQEYLEKGESYQICLTNRMSASTKTVPQEWFAMYSELRTISPAPYSAYMRLGDFAILSSSPEMFLKIDKQNQITSKPIKGTVKRGKTSAEDEQLADTLGKSDKDFAENAMIVDLVRNDLGRVCKIGSVEVTKFLDVETYATMHQLVSTVTGTLRDDACVIDVIRSAFPGGSMTGAPKLRAMEIIAELEKLPRGIYSGAIGYLSSNGTAELSIVIRTIIATQEQLQFCAGGAILVQSDPESEYQEMLLKTKALQDAIRSI